MTSASSYTEKTHTASSSDSLELTLPDVTVWITGLKCGTNGCISLQTAVIKLQPVSTHALHRSERKSVLMAPHSAFGVSALRGIERGLWSVKLEAIILPQAN